MTRFGFLLVALALFWSAPYVLPRSARVHPTLRATIGVATLAGMLMTLVSLLMALLFPEVLFVHHLSDVWRSCAAALRRMASSPVDHWVSIVAGLLLLLVLARLAWAATKGSIASRRARVRWGRASHRLSRGEPVYVLPVAHVEAYSMGWPRPQVVMTEGLNALLDGDERVALLLHEEGHIRRGHHPILAFARAVASTLAPLPGARRTLEVVEQGIEEAADRYAVLHLVEPSILAASLSKAALAGLRAPVGSVPLGRGPDVAERIRRLLDDAPRPAWTTGAALVGLAGISSVLVLTQIVPVLVLTTAAHRALGLGVAMSCPLSAA